MSSVSDQLQRNVGKSRNAAVRGDKEMCGEEEEREGDRQRERERKSEEGQSERGERGEMTPGWRTRRETLRNFVSCSKRLTDRDSVVILRAS